MRNYVDSASMHLGFLSDPLDKQFKRNDGGTQASR